MSNYVIKYCHIFNIEGEDLVSFPCTSMFDIGAAIRGLKYTDVSQKRPTGKGPFKKDAIQKGRSHKEGRGCKKRTPVDGGRRLITYSDVRKI